MTAAADNILAGLIPLEYCPHDPTARQAAGLILSDREVFYGGAAGGGKSDWLLMCALQYVDIHNYSALLLRRTFAQLSKAGGLLSRSHEWLGPTDAQWNGEKHQWVFPSGATIELGHMQHEKDKYNYQGPEYQMVGYDELTQFSESQYTYLFSRLRRLKGSPIPPRMRAASNPGGEGHDWVKQRMLIEGKPKGRMFIPARLDDNPHLDRDEYLESLAELDPVTREQLLAGDWDIRPSGGMFKREDFEIVSARPANAKRVRGWDFAATALKPGTDPDWTAAALMSMTPDGVFYIEDMVRQRTKPSGVEKLLKNVATQDGRNTAVWLEQEPGSSGKIAVASMIKLLAGFNVRAERPTGSKVDRAQPLAAQVAAGNVRIVNGPWVSDFLNEAQAFPEVAHDDQVDAASLAFSKLHGNRIKVQVAVI